MMEPAKSFRDLIVWQKAHQLVLAVYRYSDNFPGKEMYCLIPQLRRAAISVPANIAEGFKKTRHCASVVNTDPVVVAICGKMLSRYSSRPVQYRLMCSEEERDSLMGYWSDFLGIKKDEIKFQLKKKIGERRSEFGLMEVRTSDTFFRSRLQGWMDVMREQWAISLTG